MKRTKVLVVDDEVEFASALAQRLQIRGYEASAVHCAEDAFALMRSTPPDVVLMDMKMPGMHGLDVLKIIKQFDPSIEVIMLSGEGGGQSLAESSARGAFDYLLKPIDIADLIKKIDAAEMRHTERSAL